MQRLGKIYNLSVDIKVTKQQNNVIEGCMEDVEDVEDIGLDKHFNEESKDNKMADSEKENQNIDNKTSQENENITSDKNDNDASTLIEAPQAPHAPYKNLEDCSNNTTADKTFKCFYCDNSFAGNVERINHIDEEHPNKPHYPTEEAFRNRLER